MGADSLNVLALRPGVYVGTLRLVPNLEYKIQVMAGKVRRQKKKGSLIAALKPTIYIEDPP